MASTCEPVGAPGAQLDHPWSNNGPAGVGVGRDNFSVRYSTTVDFADGFYVFSLTGDDGVRLSVDGGATWLLNDWSDHAARTTTATVQLTGSHTVVVEYYEHAYAAVTQANWTQA